MGGPTDASYQVEASSKVTPFPPIYSSVMLSKVVQDKHLHRIKASRSGPAISHLFFADDNLLFSRATWNECMKIVEILKSYEEASDQKVKFEKFEVSFSRGVEKSRAE